MAFTFCCHSLQKKMLQLENAQPHWPHDRKPQGRACVNNCEECYCFHLPRAVEVKVKPQGVACRCRAVPQLETVHWFSPTASWRLAGGFSPEASSMKWNIWTAQRGVFSRDGNELPPRRHFELITRLTTSDDYGVILAPTWRLWL